MKSKRYYWMKNLSRQENLLYIVLWGILFAAPLLSFYVRTFTSSAQAFSWTELLMVWRHFAIFLLLFLLHNFFLAPLLIHQHRRVTYVLTVLALLALFTTYQCSHRPSLPGPDSHSLGRHDRIGGPDGRPFDEPSDRPFDGPFSRRDGGLDKGPGGGSDKGPDGRPHLGPDGRGKHLEPPAIIGERDIVAIAVLILMFAANLGSKLYFKSRLDQQRLAALQKENLEQQLAYLRYQINPHFLMNTLNNIHALVDIDPERSKETIVELSRMLRFVLYEGNKQGVPLSRELEFIRHYVALMRLRYTDKVKISVDLPDEVPDRQIPPLMLITFIENAFKHGVSYQHESYITIKVTLQAGTLTFSCLNSKAGKPNEEKGGVGLANVKQRLSLLYGHDFTLDIHDTADAYNVELTIPLT